MPTRISVQDYLGNAKQYQLIDVRSPSEFAKGHVPGAVNIPLFSDDERAVVGTLYKQQGQRQALLEGLKFAGHKMTTYVEILSATTKRQVPLAVHCWRGGKRSQSMAWLFEFCGYQVATIIGGYQAFRHHFQLAFSNDALKLLVLGGKTGSGKTDILRALQSEGEQVLDLERIAKHKGSAFGSIGEEGQPPPEQFENNLYFDLCQLDVRRPVWIENESKSIGRVYIPDTLWLKMKASPLIHLEVPVEDRVAHLVAQYADESLKEELTEAFTKITKRLGGQHVKHALRKLEEGNFNEAARVALTYYDKTYMYNLRKSQAPVIEILNVTEFDRSEVVRRLLAKRSELTVHTG